jgi:hypothetical protein
MKKTICILSYFAFLYLSGFSQVTDETNNKYRKNAFYIVPLPAIFNSFQIGYERTFGNATKSILIIGGIIASGDSYYGESGVSEEIQLRFFLNDIRNSGKTDKFKFAFHFSPFLSHKYIERDRNTTYEYDYLNSISSGIVSGMKGTFSHFVFDIYVGGGYKKTYFDKNNSRYGSGRYIDDGYSGVLPKIGIQLGFSF